MSINTSSSSKVFPIRRVLVIGLIIILGIAITTGFVWMHTDHVIAPPGLRLIDGLDTVYLPVPSSLGNPFIGCSLATIQHT